MGVNRPTRASILSSTFAARRQVRHVAERRTSKA